MPTTEEMREELRAVIKKDGLRFVICEIYPAMRNIIAKTRAGQPAGQSAKVYSSILCVLDCMIEAAENLRTDERISLIVEREFWIKNRKRFFQINGFTLTEDVN